MAEKRKPKQRKQVEQMKPSKEEYAVARYLLSKVKANEAKLHGIEVKYFIGSEAVDALLSSEWALGNGRGGIALTTRTSCVDLMNSMLQKGCLFHRAKKVERKVQFDKNAKGNIEKEKAAPETEKRVRLSMHSDELFVDGEEYYVWIYDPVSRKTFAIGLLLLLGVISICLFPLWPSEGSAGIISRLSWIAISLLRIILALYIVRLAVFVCVWCVTAGKRHLWLLPNLNEDVGVWKSLVPLYNLTLADSSNTGSDKKPMASNDTASGAGGDAGDGDEEAGSSDANFSEEEEGSEAGAADDHDQDDDLGASTDNGFEMLDAEEDEEERDGAGASHEDKKHQ